MLFLAAVLNYVDKNTLSLLAPTIQNDLGLSDDDYANIQNAFQVAYTIALLGSGVLVDRFGPRLSLALFVGWWSVANVLTAAARSALPRSAFRFLLGLGEAGNWTASPKAVSEWFPPNQRGVGHRHLYGRHAHRHDAGPAGDHRLAGALRDGSRRLSSPGCGGLLWLVPWLLI